MQRFGNIEIEDIGAVFFIRSKRAKNINISIKPFVGIRVAVPEHISLAQAIQFVRRKSVWINKHLKWMKQYEQEHAAAINNTPAINRKEAEAILSNRLYFLAQKYGYAFNKVSIRNQKTRWGSCSQQNNINLNIKLVRLPPELLDYVILHELVHTRFKNHGVDFWIEMDKLVGNGKHMSSLLRQYSAAALYNTIVF